MMKLPRLHLPAMATVGLMVLFTALRILLAVFFPSPNPVGIGEWFRLFLIGLHRDLVVAVALTVPLALWSCFLGPRTWGARWHRVFLAGVLTLAWAVIFFLLVAEGFFFQEFQSRYNPVAIDYLIYPHEVFVNVWQSYPLVWILLGCGAFGGTLAWMGLKASRRSLGSPRSIGSGLLWTLAAGLLVLSLSSRESRFSRDRVVNELANNTFVSLATAALTRQLDYTAFYPTMPLDQAYARARELVHAPGQTFTGASNTLQRLVPGDASRPRLNLVLLFEESLGSEFWGCLGRADPSLTPRMDELARREGMLFENLYADGNRTIRGYEAVLAGFPPLPGDSIVARDRTIEVESIAQVLKRDGYQRMFLYAGRGLFDGTGKFAVNNGWNHFVELKDFKNPTFTTAWGVCNEDLYNRAIEEMRQFHAAGQPFFVTTMSVSNHKPYTYPKNRIPQDPEARTRANVVRYTDFAIGEFFEKVRKEPFWTNTVFVVVADHGARVYGSQSIPIRSYEIPMLVLGPAAVQEPSRVKSLGCQLDVAPTLLGMIGRPYHTTLFGHDLLRHPDLANRVLLHHNRSVGIYSEQRLVVFGLNRQIEYYQGDPKSSEMRRVPAPDGAMERMVRDATAVFQVADDLYMGRRYAVQP